MKDIHDDLKSAVRRGLLKRVHVTNAPYWFESNQHSACIYIEYAPETPDTTRQKLKQFFQNKGLATTIQKDTGGLKVFIP